VAGALRDATRWDRAASVIAALPVIPAAAGLFHQAWESATILWHLGSFLFWSMRLGHEGLKG
jgi:hypothetical protein